MQCILYAFCSYLKNGLDFLTKIDRSDSSLNGILLLLLYLKFETTEHAQIAVIRF